MRIRINDDDITRGIEFAIKSGVEKAIDNNNKEVYNELEFFIFRIVHYSLSKRSINHFNQYIYFPEHIYDLVHKSSNYSISEREIYHFINNTLPIKLKNVINNDLSIESSKLKDIESIRELNIYCYNAINSFNQLIYKSIMHQDLNVYRHFIAQFKNTEDTLYRETSDLEKEIILLEINSDTDNKGWINTLSNKLSIYRKYDNYKRHVLIGIKYWTYYLYKVEYLDIDICLHIIKELGEKPNIYNNLLDEIFYFRTEKEALYMNWQDWDYKERPEMKAYSPPDSRKWLTMGYTIDLLNGNAKLINTERADIRNVDQIKFLFDDIKEWIKYFSENYKDWEKILNLNDEGNFKQRSESLLNRFALLEKERLNYKNTVIAKSKLSQDKIIEFTKKVGKAWEMTSTINYLFTKYSNRVKGESEDMQYIGRRFFLNQGKIMFIDGEYYQDIYGMDRIGIDLGRQQDNVFIERIKEIKHNPIINKSVIKVIEKARKRLEKNDITPNVILMAPEFSYKGEHLRNRKMFQSNYEKDRKFLLGYFNDIEVYEISKDIIKNNIIVADFRESFKMEYQFDEKWYNGQLKVEVSKISDKEVETRLSKSEEEWTINNDGNKISKAEAEILIRTSVNIKVVTNLVFRILNEEAFEIGSVDADREYVEDRY